MSTAPVVFTSASVVGSITLTADPDFIPADGASSSIITATIKDAVSVPVPKGTAVVFATTLGTFSNGSTTYTVITPDGSGVVSVSLKAGSTSGSAMVTATSNGVMQAVYVTIGNASISIALVASPTSIPADGVSSSKITATLTDSTGNPVAQGTAVTFSTTMGKFSNGQVEYSIQTMDANGIVVVSLISSKTAGSALVNAQSNGVSQGVFVEFTGGTPGVPASLSLAISKTSVKSDNSDSSTVTATVLDSDKAVIEGATIAFMASGGQLSKASAVTDANGRATTVFSSGTTDRSNRIVTITATVTGLGPQEIPIQIVGSTLSVSTDASTLPVNGSVALLTITGRDAGNNAVYNTPITLSQSGTGTVTLSPLSGNTNVAGQMVVSVTGATAGTVTVTATGLGTTAAQDYVINPVDTTFAVVLPPTKTFSAKTRTTASLAVTPDVATISFVDSNPDTIVNTGGFVGYSVNDVIMVGGSTSNDGVYTIAAIPNANTLTLVSTDTLIAETAGATVTITNGVLVRVRAPDPIANVVFATSIGVWDGGGSPIVTKPVPAANFVWAVLASNLAGTATVQAYDAANPSTTDKVTVSFSLPSGQAAQMTLQANGYTLPPSTGGTINEVTLTATVRTSPASGSQVVAGVPVAFAIRNPSGGGESVSPAVVITNSAGQAITTFTSGSLSTGAEGVTINAWVVGKGRTWSNQILLCRSHNYQIRPWRFLC